MLDNLFFLLDVLANRTPPQIYQVSHTSLGTTDEQIVKFNVRSLRNTYWSRPNLRSDLAYRRSPRNISA